MDSSFRMFGDGGVATVQLRGLRFCVCENRAAALAQKLIHAFLLPRNLVQPTHSQRFRASFSALFPLSKNFWIRLILDLKNACVHLGSPRLHS